jgi:hypothetical protein
MERGEPCIICKNPTHTGVTLTDGTPELVAAALTLMGLPREDAEKRAADEPGDLAVFLCVDCAENGRHFTASTSFAPFSLRMF